MLEYDSSNISNICTVISLILQSLFIIVVINSKIHEAYTGKTAGESVTIGYISAMRERDRDRESLAV